MKVSDRGRALITQWEGDKLRAYKDGGGMKFIGVLGNIFKGPRAVGISGASSASRPVSPIRSSIFTVLLRRVDTGAVSFRAGICRCSRRYRATDRR
jgi:hypothetical protein